MSQTSEQLLFYEQTGSGPAIVITHGLFGSHRNWLSVARALAGQYRVILPDWRNHGNSFHSEEHSIELLAKDLANLVTRLQLENWYLVGHSMGGLACMHYCLQQTGPLPQKLALVDIGMRQYKRDYSQEFALLSHPLAGYDSRAQLEQDFKKIIPNDQVRGFLMMNLERSASGFSWKLNVKPLYQAYRDQIGLGLPGKTSPVPTHLIYGGKSDFIDTKVDLPLLKTHFPHFSSISIADAAHWLHYTHQAEFLAHLQDFFNQS